MPIKWEATTMEIRLYALLISTAQIRATKNIRGNMIYQQCKIMQAVQIIVVLWRGVWGTCYGLDNPLRRRNKWFASTPDGVQIAEASKSKSSASSTVVMLLSGQIYHKYENHPHYGQLRKLHAVYPARNRSLPLPYLPLTLPLCPCLSGVCVFFLSQCRQDHWPC